MKWNMRLKAAERGIWKSGEMRRLLGEAGLELSAGKMSALWSGTPTTIRLDDLDVICAVLDCDAAALLINDFVVDGGQVQRQRASTVNVEVLVADGKQVGAVKAD